MRIDKRAENRVMPIVGPWWGQNNTDTFGLRPGQLWSNERGKFLLCTYLSYCPGKERGSSAGVGDAASLRRSEKREKVKGERAPEVT